MQTHCGLCVWSGIAVWSASVSTCVRLVSSQARRQKVTNWRIRCRNTAAQYECLFCRAMLCISEAYAIMWCLCVCLFVCLCVCVSHCRRTVTICDTTAGRKRRRLLFTGDVDEMFMTRILSVTPQTTEHLIACSDKSVAYVTNNKRLRSTFCTIEAKLLTDTKHHAPLCDSRATCYLPQSLTIVSGACLRCRWLIISWYRQIEKKCQLPTLHYRRIRG